MILALCAGVEERESRCSGAGPLCCVAWWSFVEWVVYESACTPCVPRRVSKVKVSEQNGKPPIQRASAKAH